MQLNTLICSIYINTLLIKMLKRILYNIYHFFPTQIILNYLKNNKVLLVFWILLFGFINGFIAKSYGSKALFLAPEYLNQTNYLSFLLYGISFGIFTTSFHISSYIIDGYQFPFMVTLSRPFIKFSINNSLFPIAFMINFMINSYNFQINYELNSLTIIILNLGSFILGFLLFFLIPFTYFFSTNKFLNRFFRTVEKNIVNKKIASPIKKVLEKDKKWKERNTLKDNVSRWKIRSYFIFPFRIRRSREFAHYSNEYIQKILHQNNFNASIFSLVILALIFVLGIKIENEYFVIPAAASILLLFTQFVFIYSIFQSVFKEWSLVAVIILLFGVNQLSKNDIIGSIKIAYGIKYTNEKLNFEEYNLKNEIADYNNELAALQNWKTKTGKKKPKIIFVNAGGGGLKMTLWTYYSLSVLDSLTKHKFTKLVRLISGASGGVIGAAYFRELYRQRLTNNSVNLLASARLNTLSKDILNPVLQSLSTKDILLSINPFRKKTKFVKDRAYQFEKYINLNTFGDLNHTLNFYREYEENIDIPKLIISPTILSTGQRILISPSNISYMVTQSYTGLSKDKNNSFEFRKLYKNFNADSLSFLSALRMNATFPYISPTVTLPGTPSYKIVDAAFIDNYGLSTSLKYLTVFKKWIKENTSGVIFVQITEEEINYKQDYSIIDEFVEPFTSSFKNIFNIQLYNNEKIVDATKDIFGNNIHFINLTLERSKLPISLNWHLTPKEKEMIYNSINSEENQKSIALIKELIATQK